ncbi:MAG: 5'-nucleotidase [Flavobacteriales bacterium]|jgi:2',3'-cyclic-nucleotide 2'-phosphodiesterase (5'-nucleotidase family)|nr:5'-nucleotidase [Flavobacteriales bacterium]
MKNNLNTNPLLLLIITLLSCNSTNKVTSYNSSNHLIDKNLSTVNYSELDLSDYRLEMSNQMNEIINVSAIEMETGSPEGVLGNFICDLSLFTCISILDIPSDFCILNNGGFRTSLPKGRVSKGKIFEIMPFDNELVVLELNGEQMIDLINYIKEKSLINHSRKAGVPVSGIRISIVGNEISRVFIGIEEFDTTKTYKVVTTDYLAKGGDNMTFFKNAKKISSTGLLLRDAIINYIENLSNQNIKLNAQLDGRIRVSE